MGLKSMLTELTWRTLPVKTILDWREGYSHAAG